MEDKELNIFSESSNGVKYSGDITVSLMNRDRVVYTKKYHNTGCFKLFDFFAKCLSGDWSDARDLRPCKIILFKWDEAGGEQLYDEDDPSIKKFDARYWTEDQKVSSKILYDGAIVTQPIYKNGKVNGYYAKYHFRVPYLCLIDGQKVHKMALYPDDAYVSSYANDMSAYFILDRDAPVEIPTAGGNFTIIIDWTLNIANA